MAVVVEVMNGSWEIYIVNSGKINISLIWSKERRKNRGISASRERQAF
jgi:hypothetical protein